MLNHRFDLPLNYELLSLRRQAIFANKPFAN